MTTKWTPEQYQHIARALQESGCKHVKTREEYILLKEVIADGSLTEVSNFRQTDKRANHAKSRAEGSGVISPYGNAIGQNDTSDTDASFLAGLDVQKSTCIATIIPSFKVIQSAKISLNIGFDTEFQDSNDGRLVLSLQMSITVGDFLIRYFFLIDPKYQEVSSAGGLIPLKYCLADILGDLRTCYFPCFPLVRKEYLICELPPPLQVGVVHMLIRVRTLPHPFICV